MPESVFRAKGILWFNESEKRHVFHLAGKRFSIDDSDWDGERKNQLVLIGQEMDHSTLRGQLKACVAKDASKGFSLNQPPPFQHLRSESDVDTEAI